MAIGFGSLWIGCNVPRAWSLGVIAGVLTTSSVASLIVRARRPSQWSDPAAEAGAPEARAA